MPPQRCRFQDCQSPPDVYADVDENIDVPLCNPHLSVMRGFASVVTVHDEEDNVTL